MKSHFCRLASVLLLMPGVLSALAESPNDQPKADAAAQITEITVQRTWCYGHCPIDKIVLRADGTASYTGTQNVPLMGQYKGTFWRGEFEALARWLVSESFFEMKDNYGIANVDISDQIITAVRDGQRKTVANHMRSSLVFWGMERVIRGTAADIQWQPELSGIRGVVTWKPASARGDPEAAFRPMTKETLLVHPADKQRDFVLSTDENGKFEITLLPGVYRIEPLIFGSSPEVSTQRRVNPQQTVTVQPGRFCNLSFEYDQGSGTTKP